MDNKSVMLRHVLRNSMIPVVTYLGQDLGALMGGAMISKPSSTCMASAT